MFPYRVLYTESEYDIQNNDLLYKTPSTHHKTFKLLYFRKFRKVSKTSFFNFVLCISCIINIFVFCKFVFVCKFGTFFYIIYITRVGHWYIDSLIHSFIRRRFCRGPGMRPACHPAIEVPPPSLAAKVLPLETPLEKALQQAAGAPPLQVPPRVVSWPHGGTKER